METGKPDLEQARIFAEAIHAEFPDQLLAYNCSPSFNWKQYLDEATIAKFQRAPILARASGDAGRANTLEPLRTVLFRLGRSRGCLPCEARGRGTGGAQTGCPQAGVE